MEIKIELDRLTVDDLVELEEGGIRAVRDVLGKFVLNGTGEYMDVEAGSKAIGALSISEMTKVSKNVQSQVKGLKDDLVPPA